MNSAATWRFLEDCVFPLAVAPIALGCVYLIWRLHRRPLLVLLPGILLGILCGLGAGLREGLIPGVPGSSSGDLYYAPPDCVGSLCEQLFGFVVGVDATTVLCCLIMFLFGLDNPKPPPQDRCKRCGYLLWGLTSDRCPECGLPFDPSKVNREPPASNDGTT